MLESKGNAVDAAVAAAFALGVCEPAASGLGGQTMMMIHVAEERRTFAVDGSSRAPFRATVESAPKGVRLRGYRAPTVPSTPAVLRYVLEQYGRLKLRRVLEPAIRLAEGGYAISPLQYALTRREMKHLKAGNAGQVFLKESARAHPVGTSLRQAALAETLRRLASRGVRDFYSGRIARAIHEDMIRNDGLIRKDDLAQVPRPIERRPITTRFAGARVFTFPLPGAGGTLLEMLNIHSKLPPSYRDPETPKGAVALAQIIRRAFLDRQDRPYDPNYSPQVDQKMLSEDYASRVARQIVRRSREGAEAKRPEKPPRKTRSAPPESDHRGETTHLSVMDRDGNAVALTQSIERVYGSCTMTPELGFLYNNYMSAYEYEDMSHPYYLRPGAIPWASVAPTIVFRGRKPWLAIGSPGSERITSSILQVLIRLQSANPFAAVEGPRMHCSLQGKVALEATRMRSDIPAALTRYGFEIDSRDPYSFYLGCVQLVLREGGQFFGVADPRRDGSAGGPAS
jgi:gamma-glutamyltranspeptidase/glutathione hydrolase